MAPEVTIATPESDSLLLANANDDGEITDDAMASLLSGAFGHGDTAVKAESGTTPEPTTEPEEKKEPEVAAEPEKEEPVVPEEPVVLAKDGKHTIPYSVVEELRDSLKASTEESRQIRQMFDEQKGLLEKLQSAQSIDQKSGNTTETDALLVDIEQDYPGLVDRLKRQLVTPLQEEVAALKASKLAEDAALQAQSRQSALLKEFNEAIEAVHPDYNTLAAPGNKEFWGWFNAQPAHIQAARTSPDPAVIAAVISQFKAEQKPAPVSEKTEPAKKKQESPEKLAEKVIKAVEAAENKNPVQSLSDIPGGTNPETDEAEAMKSMDSMDLLNKFMTAGSQDKIEKLISRML